MNTSLKKSTRKVLWMFLESAGLNKGFLFKTRDKYRILEYRGEFREIQSVENIWISSL